MPDHIIEAIRQSLGLEEDDNSQDAKIQAMSLKDALNAYLSWEGVTGYTDDILAIVNHKNHKKALQDEGKCW